MSASPLHAHTLRIRGPLERADLEGLYERACALLSAGGTRLMVCEMEGVAADAVAVDALARLALAARRYGCRTQLRGASPELWALVELIGLADVLGARGKTR